MRDRTKLYPALQEKINLLLAECKKKGLNIGISECVRTVDEQNQLYAKGRTLPGSIVTNAKGTSYSSMHQWGVAFDFYRNDGKGAFNDSDGFFAKVGKIGQSIGLEWGGSWKSIKDKPHFQLPNWGSTTTKLKKQYGTPNKFMATWNKQKEPEKPKNPYPVPTTTIKKGHKCDYVKWVQWELRCAGYDVAVDGIFGMNTEKYVMMYQKTKKIEIDGKVGTVTRSKMLND